MVKLSVVTNEDRRDQFQQSLENASIAGRRFGAIRA
jgi:hypothetical protein